MSKTNPPNDTKQVRIFDAEMMGRALRRIAHEIVERNRDLASLVLVGIPSRGVALAERIAGAIQGMEGVQVPTGIIDVSMHRDDVGTRASLPVVRTSKLPQRIEGKTIIIVDDVVFTGRTCRAAMDAIGSFGRPARIQFAALIDRGHRELPIRPDYVGKNLPTSRDERVQVRLEEIDGEADAVWLEKKSVS
jgi:pyrimidine operon attenuation protein/uracil phosphoribosyltransferase